MSQTIKLPIKARMELQPDGSYIMAAAEYADVSVDDVARVFLQAYQAEKSQKSKKELTA